MRQASINPSDFQIELNGGNFGISLRGDRIFICSHFVHLIIKQVSNVVIKIIGFRRWGVASIDLAISIDEKFCEIPFDPLSTKQARRLIFQ